jgi:hypothetical protein
MVISGCDNRCGSTATTDLCGRCFPLTDPARDVSCEDTASMHVKLRGIDRAEFMKKQDTFRNVVQQFVGASYASMSMRRLVVL